MWGLDDGPRSPAPAFKGISEAPSPWEAIAITPDGNVVVVAINYGLYAVDWKAGRFLWHSDPLDHDSFYGTALAIGDNGKTLFTGGAHVVDRLDMATGQKTGSLGPNDQYVTFLRTSRNGKVLLAGFGNVHGITTSFALWESGEREPSLRFSSPGPYGSIVGISPDGALLALWHWPKEAVVFRGQFERNLELWNWRKGAKRKVTSGLRMGRAGRMHSIGRRMGSAWRHGSRALPLRLSFTKPKTGNRWLSGVATKELAVPSHLSLRMMAHSSSGRVGR